MKTKVLNAYKKYHLKDFCITFFAWSNNEDRLIFTEKLFSIRYSKLIEQPFDSIDLSFKQAQIKFKAIKDRKTITIDEFMFILDACYATYSISPIVNLRMVVTTHLQSEGYL